MAAQSHFREISQGRHRVRMYSARRSGLAMAELPYDFSPREAREGLQEYSCSAYWIRNLQSFVSRASCFSSPVPVLVLVDYVSSIRLLFFQSSECLFEAMARMLGFSSYSDPVSPFSQCLVRTSALRLGHTAAIQAGPPPNPVAEKSAIQGEPFPFPRMRPSVYTTMSCCIKGPGLPSRSM